MCLYEFQKSIPDALVTQFDMLALADTICSAVSGITEQDMHNTVSCSQMSDKILPLVFLSRSLSIARHVPNLSSIKVGWIDMQLDHAWMLKGKGIASPGLSRPINI